jgi:hypothetical protein
MVRRSARAERCARSAADDEGDAKWARPDNDRKDNEGVKGGVRKPENRHNGRRLGFTILYMAIPVTSTN